MHRFPPLDFATAMLRFLISDRIFASHGEGSVFVVEREDVTDDDGLVRTPFDLRDALRPL
jgi:hypothetical protein